MMIMIDPPRHAKVRQVVKKWFTPLTIGKMEGRFREIARELVDAVAARGSCDLVADLAARMPSAVICEMLGVPRSEWSHKFGPISLWKTGVRPRESVTPNL